MAERRTFQPGATIFREGEPGAAAFVIEQGSVQITALKQGRDLPLATLTPGDLFGEMALIDDELRTATATALERTEVVEISAAYFKERLDAADPIINVFMCVVLERFRATHHIRLSGEGSLRPAPFSGDRISEYQTDRNRALQDLKRQRELELAVTENALRLHYQPIVNLRSGAVVGFEALMRWQHPERGLLPPAEFIGFAERSGAIVPMGLWALREAPLVLRQFQYVHRQTNPDAPPLYVSVNVSGSQLASLRNVDQIIEALASSGIDLPNVTLELTESLLMQDPQAATTSLHRLKEVGVRLSIDDFGTGYSSLGYLHRFPFDYLKLDRSFVDSMLSHPGSQKIVRGIAGLSRDLELDMIAEGIETTEQLAALTSLGCACAQGYLFARPQPSEAIVALLSSGKCLVPGIDPD